MLEDRHLLPCAQIYLQVKETLDSGPRFSMLTFDDPLLILGYSMGFDPAPDSHTTSEAACPPSAGLVLWESHDE